MLESIVNFGTTVLTVLYCVSLIVFQLKQNLSVKNSKFILIIALVFHVGVISSRWFLSGHPPILGVYEQTLVASLTLILFSVIFVTEKSLLKFLTVYAILILFYGRFFDSSMRPIIPTEESFLIYCHVVFAWSAYGFLTLNFLSNLAFLTSVGGLINPKSRLNIFSDDCRDSAVKSYGYNFAFYGFVLMALMFVFGSLYAAELYLSWWLWDPVYYLMFLVWVFYGLALHGAKFFNWSDFKIAKYFMVAYLFLVILYWVLPYIAFSTFHIFDISIKSHSYKVY